MRVKKIPLQDSLLVARYCPVNFVESLAFDFESSSPPSADDVMVAFWTDQPKWISALIKLRGILVKPFGLSSGESSIDEFAGLIRQGGSGSFASVPAKSDNETVLCLDDKHLVAYLSASITALGNGKNRVVVSTLVRFYKRFGRVYFYAILPFHGILVRSQVKRALRRLCSVAK